MSTPDTRAMLAEAVARLEAVALALEADGLTPVQLRDLADEALALAQRVSELLAASRQAEAPPAPPQDPGPAVD
jgi:hypothetical protein